jgi:hypothetical protein
VKILIQIVMFKFINYIKKRKEITRREKMIYALLASKNHRPVEASAPKCHNTALLSEMLLTYIGTGQYELLEDDSDHQ